MDDQARPVDQVTRDKKERPASVPLLFDEHEASKEIAERLISKHHHEIANAKFRFLCRNKSAKAGGVPVPGNVKKASPIEAHLSKDGCDFIMVIALDVWNDYNPTQRTAIVDHLLTRCVAVEDDVTGDVKYSIRPPQVQEFAEIAERYGRWNDSLIDLGNSLQGK